MPASAREVFAVVHDYGNRLSWDTLLSEARLLGGATEADLGIRARCTGKGWLNSVAMETVYITYSPGRVAAVKLVSPIWPFRTWAASIRHIEQTPLTSILEYRWRFSCQPAILAPALEWIVNQQFKRETRLRFTALRRLLAEKSLHSA